MIFHKLVIRFIGHGDDEQFYRIQAQDTIKWLRKAGVELSSETKALDLGAGLGLIGGELMHLGCQVKFADQEDEVVPPHDECQFEAVDIDRDDLSSLGSFNLVICSNVLEHLPRPEMLLNRAQAMLEPGGYMYLCWGNWLSPWGGHEFSPFHYLGPKRGHLIYDRLFSKPRKYTPYENLFPTYIGQTLAMLRQNDEIEVLSVVPRYYPELAFITRIPGLREVLTWNCAILLKKKRAEGPVLEDRHGARARSADVSRR